MTTNRQPIKAIENDLVTILEFVRVAVKAFPVEADRILGFMDLSDDAFEEAYLALGDAIGFDFEDEGQDDGEEED